jgi:hypothetical protein
MKPESKVKFKELKGKFKEIKGKFKEIKGIYNVSSPLAKIAFERSHQAQPSGIQNTAIRFQTNIYKPGPKLL